MRSTSPQGRGNVRFLPMPSPTARSGTSNAQFRRRIPTDLVGYRTSGLPVVIEFPATATATAHTVTVVHRRDDLRFSLGTACPTTVRERMATAVAHVDRLWTSLRATPEPVTLSLRGTVWLASA